MQFRPMSHVDIDEEGKLWFFTRKTPGRQWTFIGIHLYN